METSHQIIKGADGPSSKGQGKELTTLQEPIQFTEQDAEALLKIILDRAASRKHTSGNSSSKTLQQSIGNSCLGGKNNNKGDTSIIHSSALGLYMTLTGIKNQFINLVHQLGGRCRIDQGAMFLGITMDQLLTAMNNYNYNDDDDDDNDDDNNNKNWRIHPIHSLVDGKEQVIEYVSDHYLNHVTVIIQQQLQICNKGYISVAHVLATLPFAGSSDGSTSSSRSHTVGSSRSSSCHDKEQSQWLDLLRDRLEECDIIVRDTPLHPQQRQQEQVSPDNNNNNTSSSFGRATTTAASCRVFVATSFWKSFCVHVYGILAAQSWQKISLHTLCQQQESSSWDPTWVQDALFCRHDTTQELQHLLPPGDIHGNGTYVPQLYKEWQYKMVMDAFVLHGFIEIYAWCNGTKVDLSSTQLIQVIQQMQRVGCGDNDDGGGGSNDDIDKDQDDNDDDVVLLTDKTLLLSRNRIIAPWLALFQDADETMSCCEFTIPMEMMVTVGASSSSSSRQRRGDNNNDDPRPQLLEECLQSEIKKENCCSGTVYITKREGSDALYVSDSMLKALRKVHLPHVISAFATEKVSLLEFKDVGDEDVHNKNNNSKLTRKKADVLEDLSLLLLKANEDESNMVPPVGAFELMVLTHYGAHLGGVGGGRGGGRESTLTEFCQRAFVSNDEVRSMCILALQKQVERVQQRYQSGETVHVAHDKGIPNENEKGTQQQQDSSGGGETIVDFEDPTCFTAACIRIQMLIKFFEYASKHSMESMDQLQDEILMGCCADFTRRIHLFCFSKRDDLPPFEFSFQDVSNVNNSHLPLYRSSIDIAAPRMEPKLELSCTADPDSGQERDAMTVIKELLPGIVGQSLSYQYGLCLGTNNNNKGGTLGEFLAHVEEHTMTICGLPFKKLDKKSEKSYLATRRQVLRLRLEQASDPLHVLEYTIMILYQQVKHLCVAGTLLNGPILALLVQERKVPKAVADCLTMLATQLTDGNQTPDALLVESVRECGLSKDITKHIVADT